MKNTGFNLHKIKELINRRTRVLIQVSRLDSILSLYHPTCQSYDPSSPNYLPRTVLLYQKHVHRPFKRYLMCLQKHLLHTWADSRTHACSVTGAQYNPKATTVITFICRVPFLFFLIPIQLINFKINLLTLVCNEDFRTSTGHQRGTLTNFLLKIHHVFPNNFNWHCSRMFFNTLKFLAIQKCHE